MSVSFNNNGYRYFNFVVKTLSTITEVNFICYIYVQCFIIGYSSANVYVITNDTNVRLLYI